MSGEPLDTAETAPARVSAARRAAAGVLVVALLVLLLAGPGPNAVWDEVRARIAAWQDWVGRYPVAALLAFVLVFSLLTALPIPVLTVMNLTAGALFGVAVGTAAASLAYTAGVTAAFLAARWLLRDRVRRRAGGWLYRVGRGFERDGAYYLLTLRLIPSLPFFLVNVVMALTPIRTRTYALVSWAGVLPLTFLGASVGTELASLESPADAVSPRLLLALAGLAALPLLARKLLRLLRPPAPPPDAP